MPFTQIKIDTLQCGDKKYIEVDQPVAKVLGKGDQIKFHNNLDDNVDATIRFYPLDSKGVGEIGGFCTEMNGTTLLVPGQGEPTECTTDAVGNFAYEIVAASGHEPLDPVIIIDPSISLMMPQYQYDMPEGPPLGVGPLGGASLLAMAAPLILGGVIGVFLGRRMR